MRLNDKEFFEVIERTPLVSIDLVIREPSNQILMGLRVNNPAKGNWFVPGGRVYKGEDLNEAFKRITLAEIGYELPLSHATLLGVFTHKYDTNFQDIDGVTTHYVVLAYEIIVKEDFKIKENPRDSVSSQHSEYRWFASTDIDKSIHYNSLVYFRCLSKINIKQSRIMNNIQYSLSNARRDAFNNLVWQTPLLSLTAQAFLFTISLSSSYTTKARLIAATLSLIVALASIQLLKKHRSMENHCAKILHDYEKDLGLYEINQKLIPEGWFARISSYRIWIFVLSSFAIAAFLVILTLTKVIRSS